MPDNPTIVTPSISNLIGTSASDIYAPTRSQIGTIMAWFGKTGVSDLIKRMYASPMDSIVCLKMYPFDVVTAAGAGAVSIPMWLGGVAVTDANDDPLSVTSIRYFNATLDMGSYFLASSGNFKDRQPYATYELYLPYIGYKQIDPDEFWGRQIQVRYAVELQTGSCTAYILSTDTLGESRLVDMESGDISVDLPLAGRDGAQLMTNLVNTGMRVASGAVAMGSGAGSKNAGGVISGASTIVGGMSGSDYTIRKGSFSSGFSKWFGPQHCHLRVTKTRFWQPTSYATEYGLPYGGTATLSTLSGFTKVSSVKITGSGFQSATSEERDMIHRQLLDGVIL